MKNKVLVVPIFFVAMFVAFASPAHAAGQARVPLPKDDAVVLQQALDILKKLLDELSARISSGDEVVLGNAESINASLTDVQRKLAALDTTLLAFTDRNQAVAVQQEPVIYPAPAKVSKGTSPTIPPASLKATLPRDSIPAPAAVANTEQLAVTSSHVSMTEIVLLGILVLVAVGFIWRLRTQEQTEAPVVAAEKVLPKEGNEKWLGATDIDWG